MENMDRDDEPRDVRISVDTSTLVTVLILVAIGFAIFWKVSSDQVKLREIGERATHYDMSL